MPSSIRKGKYMPNKNDDRQRAIDAGLTEDEADCLMLSADLANSFFSLPRLHPSEVGEVAGAIHIIQDKLFARPAYRQYLSSSNKNSKSLGKE